MIDFLLLLLEFLLQLLVLYIKFINGIHPIRDGGKWKTFMLCESIDEVFIKLHAMPVLNVALLDVTF